MSDPAKKKVKEIMINPDKCNGCRACEIACASFHAKPRYSNFNPSRARIRMVINELNDEWIAIRSSSFSKTNCKGRSRYVINGKEYSECSFCSTICPDRKIFKEPDSNLPLKCDMCGEDPEQVPLCVQICSRDALTYAIREREVESDEKEQHIWQTMEMGLKSLERRYGFEKVKNALFRLAEKKS
jgi:Fe-S-cluster-containing hydrogenase component 2